MNRVEKALMYALFIHLHHNIDKAVDFKAIETLNKKVAKLFPGALIVGRGDDAAAFKFPGIAGTFAGKMESHCSPCVPRPYDASATGAGGSMRDAVAMGARPMFLMDFIGTRPLQDKVPAGTVTGITGADRRRAGRRRRPGRSGHGRCPPSCAESSSRGATGRRRSHGSRRRVPSRRG